MIETHFKSYSVPLRHVLKRTAGSWRKALFACLVLIAAPTAFPQSDPPAKIERVKTSITVTGTISTAVPAVVSVIDRHLLEEIPGVNIDDPLLSVRGFTLICRSS